MLTPLFKELVRYRERHVRESDQDIGRFIYLTRVYQDDRCQAVNLKFVHTGKKLRFSHITEGSPTKLHCQRLEKTKDLVCNIHRIHEVVDEYTMAYHGNFETLPLEKLWRWATKASDGRIFPMDRPAVLAYPNDGRLQPDQLYYGLITGFTVHGLNDQTGMVTLNFLNDSYVTIVCTRTTALNLSPGLIWVGNSLGHYRIAKLHSIRYHVLFTREEYNHIKQWIYGQLDYDPVEFTPPYDTLFSTY